LCGLDREIFGQFSRQSQRGDGRIDAVCMMKYLAKFNAKAIEEMKEFVRFGWGNIWRIFSPKPVRRWKN
jgi:hypothetical protein